jgi:hypothetical protein
MELILSIASVAVVVLLYGCFYFSGAVSAVAKAIREMSNQDDGCTPPK